MMPKPFGYKIKVKNIGEWARMLLENIGKINSSKWGKHPKRTCLFTSVNATRHTNFSTNHSYWQLKLQFTTIRKGTDGCYEEVDFHFFFLKIRMCCMKKIGGQEDLVKGNLPELEDKEVAQKLEQIWKLREGAKLHDKLQKEAKEVIMGWVLGLPKKDQKVGKFKCGDFVLTFKVEMQEAKPVEYETKGGKKVKVRFAPDKEEEE